MTNVFISLIGMFYLIDYGVLPHSLTLMFMEHVVTA
jgi:hypothetical protein